MHVSRRYYYQGFPECIKKQKRHELAFSPCNKYFHTSGLVIKKDGCFIEKFMNHLCVCV